MQNSSELEFEKQVAPFRRELTAHCYRMSGSVHDAEDLAQEALLRAWRGFASFEGRSSLRTWLYRIATNTCLNALESRKARALPIDLGPPGGAHDAMAAVNEPVWLEPCPPELYGDAVPTPEARYSGRQSVALAFVAALQLLPARQRAVLILSDVLGFSAAEVADDLTMTVAAVNSALQRARATVDARAGVEVPALKPELRERFTRYLRAWEGADLDGLVALLHDDATLAMPPLPVWLRGTRDLEASMRAMVFAAAKPGEFRAVETHASGLPALALYRSGQPYALHVLEWRGDRIAAITAFLDVSLFPRFGL